MKSAIREECIRGVINSGCVGQKKKSCCHLLQNQHVSLPCLILHARSTPLGKYKGCNGETGLEQVDTSYMYRDHGGMDPLCKQEALQNLKVALKRLH